MRPEREYGPAEELNALAAETVKDVRKNKIVIPILLAGLLIAVIVVFVTTVLPAYRIAIEEGKRTGDTLGSVAGLAVGTVTRANQAYSDAKGEAQTADDTVVTIARKIENDIGKLGKLEVMVAKVEVTTYHEVGNKYGAMYLVTGSAVFTVDMDAASVTTGDGLILIALPRPEAEIRVNPTEREKIAEWQRKLFNGTEQDGYNAALNSYFQQEIVAKDQVNNYSALVEQAAKAAVEKIKELAEMARGDNELKVSVSILAE